LRIAAIHQAFLSVCSSFPQFEFQNSHAAQTNRIDMLVTQNHTEKELAEGSVIPLLAGPP